MSGAADARAEILSDLIDRKMADGMTYEDAKREAERQQAADEPRRGFFFTRADALKLHAPDWLVRGRLERNTFVVIFGKFGSAKSFIIIDIAAAFACGIDWHGHKVGGPGVVAVLAGEGHSGFSRRLKAFEIARGVSLEGKHLFISSCAGRLGDPAFLSIASKALAEIAEETGGKIDLVIVDTWSRNLSGDENSSADSALAVADVDRLRAPYQAAAIIVHHEGWTEGRTRGSTVLMAAADAAFRVERGTDATIRLTAEKIKDGATPDGMAFELVDHDLGLLDDEGLPVRSASLEPVPFTPSPKRRAPSGKNQRKAMDVLAAEFVRNGENLTRAGQNPETAKVSLDQWKTAAAEAGIDRRRFPEVVSALVASAQVKIESGGYVNVLSE